MGRTHNTTCSIEDCENSFYKRPKLIEEHENHFCSFECYNKHRSKEPYTCPECGEDFIYNKTEQTYCSPSCAGKASRGDWDTTKKRKPKNPTELKREILLENGTKYVCAVEGCSYSKTLDVHRKKPGSEGGEYNFENMFFLCPNHHAEVTRGITEFEEIDNFTLREK